ncbi:ABC transporter ATP-binding protein [Oceanotoga sp. DSM 15011]|jgi:peptide/nickel transport system ATP-binding protein|uniref:ABC transporter ATP-binding protein n=1 Tax=Oceanotoga sp. DSM 15011 TaxID=2984951 RepID=UPI0021F4A604|nr:ABC transporter ATP-binding protein [Oceanotoga sp. DSM 15011]UYO99227.1 ABC transporter ATP-binding protein [Oceanotoga sp. DSM 15011]
MDKDIILKVENVKTYFPIRQGFWNKVVNHVKAVNDVSFELKKKETLGVVGESGCGKSTLAKTIMRGVSASSGKIIYNKDGQELDILALKDKELKSLGVRKDIQMIFQDPFSSLSPRMTVKEIITEPLLINKMIKSEEEVEKAARELIADVNLDPKYLRRYPHAFSGGQRQRVGVARSLALNPKIILADEPTSALDVSVQSQLLNLLRDLQEKYELSMMFISHDLGVVEHISDRVAVMYVGNIVEIGDVRDIFNHPVHPYTKALLSAVPVIDPHKKSNAELLEGDVADPANLPSGCPFHPRCKYAKDICKHKKPILEKLNKNESTQVACHFKNEL